MVAGVPAVVHGALPAPRVAVSALARTAASKGTYHHNRLIADARNNAARQRELGHTPGVLSQSILDMIHRAAAEPARVSIKGEILRDAGSLRSELVDLLTGSMDRYDPEADRDALREVAVAMSRLRSALLDLPRMHRERVWCDKQREMGIEAHA